MIWLVIWVVLMLFWLFGHTITTHEVAHRIVPWLCVLIIGLIVFGALGAPAVFVREVHR